MERMPSFADILRPRTCYVSVLFSLVVQLMLGQSSSIPYGDVGPTFDDQFLSYTYNQHYASIHDIDFRNLTLRFFDKNGNPANSVRLEKGKYEHKEPLEFESIKFESIEYVSAADALVVFSDFVAGGSGNGYGEAQLFSASHGRLRVEQDLHWDENLGTNGPSYSFDRSSKTLVIPTAHYLPGDAHCCVSAMDVITLRWEGRRFVQTDLKTELSDYGKTKGLKLAP